MGVGLIGLLARLPPLPHVQVHAGRKGGAAGCKVRQERRALQGRASTLPGLPGSLRWPLGGAAWSLLLPGVLRAHLMRRFGQLVGLLRVCSEIS